MGVPATIMFGLSPGEKNWQWDKAVALLSSLTASFWQRRFVWKDLTKLEMWALYLQLHFLSMPRPYTGWLYIQSSIRMPIGLHTAILSLWLRTKMEDLVSMATITLGGTKWWPRQHASWPRGIDICCSLSVWKLDHPLSVLGLIKLSLCQHHKVMEQIFRSFR